MATSKDVKDSMIEQLRRTGRATPHNLDMVDRYMELRQMAATLRKDVRQKGIRYTVTNGNGFEVEKDNASVRNLASTVQAMLNLRQKMKLDEALPDEEPADEGIDGYV